MTRTASIAFEKVEYILPLSKIIPQRVISPEVRHATKYKMIANSIRTIGLIEALVVYPRSSGDYLLLDGHSRLDALKDLGVGEVRCTLATDDEAYTYNKRVNTISKLAQHFMIQKALENGVSEERLSQALGLNPKSIRVRRDMLNGICPEAVQLLRNKKTPIGIFAVLRKMKPVRQVEAVEHMIAGGTYSVVFANALLAVTQPDLLVKPTRKRKTASRLLATQEMLGMETQRLVKDLKMIEESYGTDVLSLTVCSAYLNGMLANQRVERYLSREHSELLIALGKALQIDAATSIAI